MSGPAKVWAVVSRASGAAVCSARRGCGGGSGAQGEHDVDARMAPGMRMHRGCGGALAEPRREAPIRICEADKARRDALPGASGSGPSTGGGGS